MDLGTFVSSLLALIPKLLYMLVMSVLSFIDLFQLIFRKLAGLDCYYVDGVAQTGDVVTQFIKGILFGGYPILSNVFFGLLILGGILLFLSTIVAIIRNEYTTDKAENSKAKIIGKAFKSIIFTAIIPVVVLFGMYLANVVLIAVDSATTYNTNYGATLDKTKLQAVDVYTQSLGSGTPDKTYITYNLFGLTDSETGLPYGTTTTTFSGTIFKASAYWANRIRSTQNAENTQNFGYLLKNGEVTDFNGLFSDPSGNTESIATKIDIAFADNVIFAESCYEQLDTTTSDYIKGLNNYSVDPYGDPSGKIYTFANKYDVQLVWYYYDLWHFNYFIAICAGAILFTVFLNLIFGMMRRIVELIGLFLMAPPLIALMPLDNEKAYGNWRSAFLKKALMIYGAVAGMNIVMLLLPELQTIQFFAMEELNLICNTLLVLVAILAIKDFIGIISGFIGSDDANKVGESVGKDVGELAAKGLKVAASGIGMLAGVGGVAVGAGKFAGGLALKGLSGAAGKVASHVPDVVKNAGQKVASVGRFAKDKAGAAFDKVHGMVNNQAATRKARNRMFDAHFDEIAAEMEKESTLDPRLGTWDDMKKNDPGLYRDRVRDYFNSATMKGIKDPKSGRDALERIRNAYYKREYNSYFNEALNDSLNNQTYMKNRIKNSGVVRAGKSVAGHTASAIKGISEKTASLGSAISSGVNDIRQGYNNYVNENKQLVQQPMKNLTLAVRNAFDEAAGMMNGSGFGKALLGDKNAHVEDIGYRLVGKTSGQVEKENKKKSEQDAKDAENKYREDTLRKLEDIAKALKK